jgi:RNase adaptor protein for sRNA GlmZ degradation
MRPFGYILIALSFLASSLAAVHQTLEIQWAWFIPLILGGVAGVMLVRMAIRQKAQAVEEVAANISTIRESLHSVVKKIAQLNLEKSNINTYDMRHRIDEKLVEDLDTFADAREAIGHKYGLQHYADVMSHFAAGERYINRVWSASTDGYIDEVNKFMEKAEEQFSEAFSRLEELRARHP